MVSGGFALQVPESIFEARLARSKGDFSLHRGRVVLQERETVKGVMHFKGIELFSQGFLGNGASLREEIQRYVSINECGAGKSVAGAQPMRFLYLYKRLVELLLSSKERSEFTARHTVSRIGFRK